MNIREWYCELLYVNPEVITVVIPVDNKVVISVVGEIRTQDPPHPFDSEVGMK